MFNLESIKNQLDEFKKHNFQLEQKIKKTGKMF